MFITPVLCLKLDDNIAYYVVGGVMVLLGANTSVLSASVMGLASTLPVKYIGAVVTGCNLSGCITGTIKIILLFIFPAGSLEGAWVFFGLAGLVCI
jgi:hypothetical protein